MSQVSRRRILAAGGAIGVASIVTACGMSDGGSAAGEQSEANEGQAGGQEAGEDGGASSGSAASPGSQLGPVAEVPVGGGRVNDTAQIVITQPQAGTIKAFTAVCPHQGCLVSTVENNEILCPCHGSLFSAEDGAVLQGPAQTGLAPVNVAIEGDMVVLA